MCDIVRAIIAAMPEMNLDSADWTVTSFGDNLEKRTLWHNYSDDAGRIFGITAVREIVMPGSPHKKQKRIYS